MRYANTDVYLRDTYVYTWIHDSQDLDHRRIVRGRNLGGVFREPDYLSILITKCFIYQNFRVSWRVKKMRTQR